MSFPCKENLIFFERLEPTQGAIYGDGCDVGLLMHEQAQDIARYHLRELMKFYGYRGEKWERGSKVKLFIPIEPADYPNGSISGITLVCEWNDIKQSNKAQALNSQQYSRSCGYLYILVMRRDMSVADAKENYNCKMLD